MESKAPRLSVNSEDLMDLAITSFMSGDDA